MTPRLIERVAEADVIAEFLRAEVHSPRFGARVRARLEADGRGLDVLTSPDTSNAGDNAYRADVLREYRGVGRSAPLLEGLPDGIEWYRATLPRDELGAVHYIDYPYWNELSGGTRSPAEAARRIRAGLRAQDRPNDGFHAAAERLCAGEDLGMPILIGTHRGAPLIVFEGHTRITAMALRPDCLAGDVELFVGYAAGIVGWIYYGRFDGGSAA